eukprot:7487671-Prorocentrum_lima.AAC.1
MHCSRWCRRRQQGSFGGGKGGPMGTLYAQGNDSGGLSGIPVFSETGLATTIANATSRRTDG